MDIANAFLSKVKAEVALDSSVLESLSLSYPNFSSRLFDNSLSLDELKEIHAFIRRANTSSYKDVTIAIRLGGGIVEVANKLNLSSDKLLAMLNDPSVHESELSNMLVSNGIVSSDFFTRTRVFFTESQVTRYRRDNLTNLLLTASDYQSVVLAINAFLSPHDDVLLSIQQGKVHPRASWACRIIESQLSVELGLLDKPSRNN